MNRRLHKKWKEMIEPFRRKLRQTLQKLDQQGKGINQKKTESGISFIKVKT